jgi:hypothetical protein
VFKPPPKYKSLSHDKEKVGTKESLIDILSSLYTKTLEVLTEFKDDVKIEDYKFQRMYY